MNIGKRILPLLAIALLSLAIAQNDEPAPASDGAEQYQLFCAACHMSDGQGAEGAGIYPALANNPAVAASPDFVILRILHGRGAMPAFGSLSDEQVAAIVNFVRTSFNDAEDEIGTEQVEAFR